MKVGVARVECTPTRWWCSISGYWLILAGESVATSFSYRLLKISVRLQEKTVKTTTVLASSSLVRPNLC